MSNYLIHPIPLCKGKRNKTQLTYRKGAGETVEICCYIWYLEGPGPKTIIDTGTSAEWYHLHGVPQQEHIQSLEDGLKKFGVQPEEIDVVILTHLHTDHVEQARKFKNARFIIQKAELEGAHHPVMAAEQIIVDDLNYVVVQGDAQVAEGIRALFTPGHSPGTQSVAVDTAVGVAVISGFCSIKDNFGDQAKGIPISVPGVYTNLLDAYDSIIKVKRIGDIVIPLHDMEFVSKDLIS
jgi:N-acyl homoserine lactone hydrolase